MNSVAVKIILALNFSIDDGWIVDLSGRMKKLSNWQAQSQWLYLSHQLSSVFVFDVTL